MKPFTLRWWLYIYGQTESGIGQLTEIKHRTDVPTIKRACKNVLPDLHEKRSWILERINNKYGEQKT